MMLSKLLPLGKFGPAIAALALATVSGCSPSAAEPSPQAAAPAAPVVAAPVAAAVPEAPVAAPAPVAEPPAPVVVAEAPAKPLVDQTPPPPIVEAPPPPVVEAAPAPIEPKTEEAPAKPAFDRALIEAQAGTPLPDADIERMKGYTPEAIDGTIAMIRAYNAKQFRPKGITPTQIMEHGYVACLGKAIYDKGIEVLSDAKGMSPLQAREIMDKWKAMIPTNNAAWCFGVRVFDRTKNRTSFTKFFPEAQRNGALDIEDGFKAQYSGFQLPRPWGESFKKTTGSLFGTKKEAPAQKAPEPSSRDEELENF